ncbi:hypothetical protein PK35_02380 [Tamlana nanhaiensis]|uniref:non-specific protein-tyrosine kinase n=1 Tax=Neotamlana nanhaiensis TaxID=1382798 RepID=A0A0D7W667_9FLAO|nr:tyrosine-protein kinase family protein [Tamlana nanhaiensis]KJD34641.1 hypothetical protein PK35_02380 [Tamlana nanhaiensis]
MEKNVIKIIAGYLKYWYLFLIGVLICVTLAFFYVRYKITPEYYIGGKVMLNDKEQGGGLQDFNNVGLIKKSSNIEDEIGVLRSYDLMKQTIEELGLMIGYYAEGRFSEIELYGREVPFKLDLIDSVPIAYGTLGSIISVDEYSYRIEKTDNDDDVVSNEVHNYGELVETNYGTFKIELKSEDFSAYGPVIVRFKNPQGVASKFNAKIQVYSINTNGGLLQLGLTDSKPQRGLDLINKLVDVYAQNSADNKNFLAKSTLKLIDERLELLTEDLNSAERDVENFKQSNDLTNVESDAGRFIALADGTERELADLRLRLNAIGALERGVVGASTGGAFKSISAYNIDDVMLRNAIATYNLEAERRNNLVSNTGTGNPLLPEIDSKLNQSLSLISQNVKSIKIELIKLQKELLNKLAQYRSRKASVPTAERALLEINRDQGIKNNLYLFLLQKREEEALSISVPFSDVRIVEAPKATGFPVNGAKTPVYLGAVLLGLFVPFAFVFIKDIMNTKIFTNEDIEAKTNTPIIGKISENNSKDVLVVSSSSVSPIAELFRLMRHNLRFLSQNKENKVIMVTSTKQGEGKTFVSINTAASLALTGKKVVVVGFDLRVPKLMKEIGMSYDKGLSDYIIDESIDEEQIISSYDKQDNMFFIGAGSIPPNPGELMLSSRVEQLITYLKQNYDYVIIDTPPIGKVSDAYSLAPFVNSTLFVVRYNYTKKEELAIVDEISRNDKLNSVMIVFNDVKLDKTSNIYSYGYGQQN